MVDIQTAPPVSGADLPAPPRLPLDRLALFADLDGTLTEIQPTPDDVIPDASRRRLLDRLTEALGGRVAVISGRGLGDLDRILEGRVAALGAVHGLVRRSASGDVVGQKTAPGVAVAVSSFEALARTEPGVLVEDKGLAAALHFRAAPPLADRCRALADQVAADNGLALQIGDMVAEVRAPGPDKGDAVAAFMAERPFAGAVPVYIGDDFTDEDGFRVAKALGGHGVIVGPRRPTAADYALDDVGAVAAWLTFLLEADR